MQKITPFLWFDDKAVEAANFYVGIFNDSRVVGVTRYADGAPRPKGSVMTVHFQLEGQDFLALNGGPGQSFSPAISLQVNCETQAEVDALWEKLSEGGERQRWSWLRDKYGISWQIVPVALAQLLHDKDHEKSRRVLAAMLQMDKIDIAALERAAAG